MLGARGREPGIFDQVLDVVRRARRFIVLDYSLFAGTAAASAPQRRIAAELSDALLARRRALPDLKAVHHRSGERGYGAAPSAQLQLLATAVSRSW